MADGVMIQVAGLKEAQTYFNRLALIAPQGVIRALNRTRIRIESLAKQNSNSGSIRQSIHGDTDERNLTATVGSFSAVAGYVEFGTAPHMPPVQALEAWVAKNFDVAESDTSGEGNEDEVNAAAWALAMTIKEFGTQPHPFLFPAVEESIPFYIQCLQEELGKVFKL